MYRSSKTSLQFQTTSQTHCCAAKQGLATFQLAFKKIHTPHTHTPRKADEDCSAVLDFWMSAIIPCIHPKAFSFITEQHQYSLTEC